MTAAWYVVVALAAAWLLFTLRFLGRLRELHHGYYGLVLMLTPWGPVRFLGAVLFLDDIVQHWTQALALAAGTTPPPDFTPIHQLGAEIVGWWRHWRGEE